MSFVLHTMFYLVISSHVINSELHTKISSVEEQQAECERKTNLNSMVQNTSSDVNVCTPNRKIPLISCNLNFHCHFNESLPLILILTQIIQTYNSSSSLLTISF